MPKSATLLSGNSLGNTLFNVGHSRRQTWNSLASRHRGHSKRQFQRAVICPAHGRCGSANCSGCFPALFTRACIFKYAAFVHPKPTTFSLYPVATFTSADAVTLSYFSRIVPSHL